ncbi:phage major capsid protein [Kitasatospora cheerisanensis]|uniref:Phage capsid-like C-terminal domain-containing protein n=1 Tax=Kitasatospora cheerisanensis KCTC 2395 TaxID=1348663 RepID=A0A066YT08_9ACTN|nr:phage major capsid protein [Kitasatospora cheerisanensis]KDN84382.1 hypothetical protein KCH_41730 [Kitasatospora cheerisanensis KCTC 2395]
MADAPVKLSNVNSTLLPPTITAPIFNRVAETSAVMQRARRIPLSMTASTAIPVSMDIPNAGWVNEGGSKPTGTESMTVKTMAGKKVAVLVPVSEEVARSNAAGLYSQIQQDLPVALSRAFDLAAIHGKTPSGAAGPFDDHLAETTNSITLGTATKTNGGIWKDIVDGEALVIDDNYDVTGWVADPRLRPQLLNAVDNNGRPLFVDTTSALGPGAAGAGSLLGLPLDYSRGISGKLVRASGTSDTGLRMIGGDWSQCAYGVGMDITMKLSTEANYKDADGNWHSAFQENLVLLLCEAHFGFVIGDENAFVKYVAAGGGS